MKRILLYTALLLTIVAQSAWAYDPTPMKNPPTEGPWTYDAVRCGTSYNKGGVSFNGLNGNAWAAQWDGGSDSKRVYQWQNKNGTGFTIHCRSGNFMNGDYCGVYSTYTHSEPVEPFTVKRLTWNYKVSGGTDYVTQTTALYAHNDLNALKNTNVDYSGDYSNKSGKSYCIGYLVQKNDPYNRNPRTESTAELTKTFDFDNSNVDTARIITWAIMLTYVAHNTVTGTNDIDQWGGFKDFGSSWQTLYYKQVTYNGNGGTGTMSPQTIETSGSLKANTFTRTGYTFMGWTTAPDGEVEYSDKQAISVNNSNKGRLNLYAVWSLNTYTISYDLDGGDVETPNPETYSVETETFTLTNPTKQGDTFMGWTGTNGIEPQTELTIAKGSIGNRTYHAHWMSSAAIEAIAMIDAIGEVEYTEACKAKIDQAQEAYGVLTNAMKAQVTAVQLETLQTAVSAYAVLDAYAKIEAIGEVTYPESEAAIEAARTAYDRLSAAEKAQVTNYATLTDAEAAYATAKENAKPKNSFVFLDKQAEQIGESQDIKFDYPAAPEVQDKTFDHWQTEEKNITAEKTIVIKAVYE